MDDLIVAAKGGVLVSKRVETVRTRGDDLWRADAVQQLDVALRLLLEAVLVADPPRRVTRAGLSRTEYRKGDASPLEQASKRLGGASPSVVERTGATSPVEVLDVVGDRAVDDTDGKVQLFVPRRPFRGTKTPRVATRLDVAQHRDAWRPVGSWCLETVVVVRRAGLCRPCRRRPGPRRRRVPLLDWLRRCARRPRATHRPGACSPARAGWHLLCGTRSC